MFVYGREIRFRDLQVQILKTQEEATVNRIFNTHVTINKSLYESINEENVNSVITFDYETINKN